MVLSTKHCKIFAQRYIYPRNWETYTLVTVTAWNCFMWLAALCCMFKITSLRITMGTWWSMAPQEGTEKPLQSSEGKDVLNFAYAHTWKFHVCVILLSKLKMHTAMSQAKCSRKPLVLLTCCMWQYLPHHLSVAFSVYNPRYKAKLQEITEL